MNNLILIVDDDARVRDVLSEELELHGFRVTTACNGVEGVKAIESEQPALVLLDMQMPLLDGVGFARKLAQLNRCIPTIVMSGDADAEGKAQEMGAVDCLAKPFGLTRLLSSVESALRAAS